MVRSSKANKRGKARADGLVRGPPVAGRVCARMYRFLTSKRWIALLLVVLVFAIACVELGLWQLRRLDQRKTLNAAISSHIHMPVEPVEDAFAQGTGSALYRHVTATGRFDVSEEIVLSGRAMNDRPGNDLLTPLRLQDGRALWELNPVASAVTLVQERSKIANLQPFPSDREATATPSSVVARSRGRNG